MSSVHAERRVKIGRGLFASTTALLGVAVALELHAGHYDTVVYPTISAALGVIGVVLTTRLPEHRISWVLAVTAFWGALGGLAFAYAYEALIVDPGSLPGGLAAAWLDNWWWLPGLALPPAALLLLMPDGHLASRRWWPVAAAVLAGTVLGSIAVSASPTFDLHAGTPIENPLARVGGVPVAAAGITGAILLAGGLLASLSAFIVRFRRSTDEERLQLRWVGLSLGVAVPLFLVGSLLWGVVPGAELLPAIAFLALPIGIAVAILKYRLYEIDLVINRSLVYGLMTVGIVAGYIAVVALVGSVLSSRGDFLLSAFVTGLVAVCFQPVRQRVQRFVNRLMYGERDDPYTAIAKLSRTLASSLQLDGVLANIVETIGETLALSYVGVALDAGNNTGLFEIAAEYGISGADSLTVPLIHQGAVLGELRFAPRPGERLRERDHRLISDLAPQVAAAAHALGLSRELQLARQRIVQLREEERRRIRRDLHDGLGPALAGLTFTLEAVRNLTGSDAERADALLVSATAQVQTMIGDVRRLIYGLRPPTLDQLGLAASLRGLAAQETTATTAVNVNTPASIPPLPAAVEVAAYWIAQEALTNVKRHARARSCSVRLAVESTILRLEIADNGAGLSNGSTGIGLHSMRERAAEVGGTCEIGVRTGGGTLVVASLPRLATEAAVG
ncbi:sensor histidine kinase [Gaiella sp.]|uniref:sensor histidine kinase n=1 Tax=Gaiella sp. TaxID=2663207 RepID=UPI0032670228